MYILISLHTQFHIIEAAKCHQQLQISQFKTREHLNIFRHLANDHNGWNANANDHDDDSGNGINDKQHDDHSGSLPHLVRRPLGFKKGLSIASLNINGLRTHLDEVKELIQNLGIHILALIETKLDPSFPKELAAINGYRQERLERTCHGGGVSTYVRDPINYKQRTDLPMDDLELLCTQV